MNFMYITRRKREIKKNREAQQYKETLGIVVFRPPRRSEYRKGGPEEDTTHQGGTCATEDVRVPGVWITEHTEYFRVYWVLAENKHWVFQGT